MGLAIFGISNHSYPQWVPEPNNRGTWSLVQTCVLTLGLCVYSAIHLNIFHAECRWWTRWLIRTKWLIIALLAPEFVVFNAWSQRRQAARLARMLRRRSGQEEPESFITTLCRYLRPKSRALDQEKGQQQDAKQNIPRQEPQEQESTKGGANVSLQEIPSTTVAPERFELTHGFMIVMGGLAVDMSRDNERVWPEWCNTLTLTSAGAEECLGKTAFQDISLGFMTRDRISSRQKVDQLAKTLIILQATWFCLQFVVRIRQSLPVSLLELNTFAHSLCALFIYILWWHKPGDIDEPFAVHTEDSQALKDLCAAQWASGASGKHYEGQRVGQTSSKKQLNSAWTAMFVHDGSELMMNIFRGRRGVTLCPGSGEDWYIFDHADRWFYFPHLPSTDRFKVRTRGTDSYVLRLEAQQLIPGTDRRVAPQFESVEVDTITMERWRRTHQSPEYCQNYSVWLRDRQPNFAWPRGLDSEDGPAISDELMKSLFMLLVTSLCYGGLHMLAWDSGVLSPTGGKRLFWKLSCMLLMALGPFTLSVWAGLKAWRGADAHLRLNQTLSLSFSVFGILVSLAYIMSRVYLMVEIILVIPYMDPGVYQEANFAIYWPHFG